MPLASLPGPFDGQWHIGPVPVHGYALCVVLGLLLALWVAERRYRAAGGRPWLIVDMATIVVPAAFIGARLYRILTEYHRYFGHGSDWVGVLRIWDGGLGLPGAVAGGLLAALIWCRKTGTGIGPVLAAAVPGLAFGQAVAVLGNWFSQSMYGAQSSLPWAVPISPGSRVPGYQAYATFQPLFLYEAIWDVLIGLVLIRAIRTFRLTGGQALAGCAGLFAVARLAVAFLLLTGPRERGTVLAEQLASIAVLLGAAAYLYLTRQRHGPQPLTIARRDGAPRLPAPAASPASAATAASPESDADPAGPHEQAGAQVSSGPLAEQDGRP
jgi:prolipoprotein diacylglyceryl transferase